MSKVLFLVFISSLIAADRVGLTKVGKWRRRRRYRRNSALIIRVGNELNARSSYYRRLDEEAKDEFHMRVLEFLGKVRMIDEQLKPLDFRRRVLVASACTQLTFGMNDHHISELHTIKIFSGHFKLGPRSPLMKGATSMNGVIFLSWPDVLHGMDVADDGLHLTLHEFAHALHIYHSDCSKCSFGERMMRFSSRSYLHYSELKDGRSNFLRSYGGTNRHEFFAVCCEAFFEKPEEFCQQYPRLYMELVHLLQQDPVAMSVNRKKRPIDWSEKLG